MRRTPRRCRLTSISCFTGRVPIEDFRLYSPRLTHLSNFCSTGESRNDPEMALKIIRDSLGEEVARTTITLLPNESVDTEKV